MTLRPRPYELAALVALGLTAGCRQDDGSGGAPNDTAPSSDDDSATTEGNECEQAPDFSDVCSECRADLLACYAPPCDFEYDPNDCVSTTLEFPQCECAMGGDSTGTTTTGGGADSGTSTGGETGTSTGMTSDASTTGGLCEEPPDFPGVCNECLVDLLSCYDGPCDFEYDPRACVDATLGFPQCECAGGSSTG